MVRFRFTAPLAAAALLALAACSDDTQTPLAPSATPAAARAEGQIPTRAQERPGTFVDLGDEALWEHVAAGGGVATVGLKAPGAPRGFYRGKVLVDAPTWSQAGRAVLAQRGVTLLQRDDLLPTLKVRLTRRTRSAVRTPRAARKAAARVASSCRSA